MRRYSVIIFCLCLLLFLLGCSRRNEHEISIKTIDLEKAIDLNVKGKSLSEFCDTIIYIPLETSNTCLLDDIDKVVFYNDDIFISDHQGLYKFNQSGKFICKIGVKGRGPDEYSRLADFFIKTDTIYIKGWNKVFAYDTHTGNLLYSTRFDDKYPKNYINKTNRHFVSFNYINNTVEFYSGKGQLSDSAFYSRGKKMILDRAIGYTYYDILFGTSNSLKITTFCNDTIFEITDGCSLIPKYEVKLGKYKMPEKYRPDYAPWDDFAAHSQNYLRKIVIETKDYMIVQIGSWFDNKFIKPMPIYPDKKLGIIGLGIYDKKRETLSLISKDDEKYPCFYPNFTDGENHLLSFVNPIEALTFYDQNKNKGQINKSFYEVVQNLKIDDNPVVIIAKLKE